MKFAAAFILLASGGCIFQLHAQPSDPSSAARSEDPAPQQSVSQQGYGKIEDDIYVSPTGLFRVKIPVIPQLGGSVTDTQNVVTFADDYSIHVRIGAFPLAGELKIAYETHGAKDFLIDFFDHVLMADFVAEFPGSTREQSAVFLPHVMDGAMLFFSLHPSGSSFEARSTVSRLIKPVIAKRGNLCFVKNGHVFIVSTELAERALERSTYKKTPEEEDAVLSKRLQDLVSKMEVSQIPSDGRN